MVETSLAGSVFNSGLDLHFCSAVGCGFFFFSSLCAPFPLFSQSSPSFLNCPYQNWVVLLTSTATGKMLLAREASAGRKVRPRPPDVVQPWRLQRWHLIPPRMILKGRCKSSCSQRDLQVLGSAAPTTGWPLKGETEMLHVGDGHAKMHICQVTLVFLSGVPKLGHKIMGSQEDILMQRDLRPMHVQSSLALLKCYNSVPPDP